MKRLLPLLVLVVVAPATAAAQPAEAVEYYGRDVIGSIRIVWDANGNVLGRQDYAPFGRPLFPVPQIPKEGFGAQEKDDETEQGYFHARMFEERTGRFTAPDPIGAGLWAPQRWNRYSYALNNPASYTDYNGLLAAPWAVSCENPLAWQESRCSLAHLFDQTNGQSGGVTRGTQGTGGATTNKPPVDNPTTTETSTETTQPTPDLDPDPPTTNCHEFSEALVTVTISGSNLFSRLDNLRRSGASLVGTALENPFRGRVGTSGFKTAFIDREQGNGVYKHILATVGLTLSTGFGGYSFTQYDAIESIWRPESRTETIDDIAGLAISGILAAHAVSGNVTRAQQQITSVLCK